MAGSVERVEGVRPTGEKEEITLYEKYGEKYFVVDGHVHFWDASPENYRNEEYGHG